MKGLLGWTIVEGASAPYWASWVDQMKLLFTLLRSNEIVEGFLRGNLAPLHFVFWRQGRHSSCFRFDTFLSATCMSESEDCVTDTLRILGSRPRPEAETTSDVKEQEGNGPIDEE